MFQPSTLLLHVQVPVLCLNVSMHFILKTSVAVKLNCDMTIATQHDRSSHMH